MDIASMLVGAGLFTAGFGTGLSLGLPFGRTSGKEEPRQEGPKKATCECSHSLAHHSPEKKNCTATVEVDKYVNGCKYGKEWRACECLQYVGPPPPEEHFALGHTY